MRERWEDPDYLKKLRREEETQDLKITAVKLPCACDMSLEITEPRDQLVRCPRCFKPAYIVWSMVSKKVQWNS